MKNLAIRTCLITVAPLLMLGFYGCQKGGGKDLVITIKQQQGEALAEVGNYTLTVEELKQKFQQRQGSFQGAAHLNTDKKRSEFIDNMVTQKALFLAAVEKGITNDPEVIEAFEKTAVQKMLRDLMAEAQANFKPSDEEMKEYYEKNPSYFKHGEAYKVAYLGVPMGKDKKKAKEIAQKLQSDAAKNVKASDTREFARLAVNFAQDPKNKNKSNFTIETNESPYLEKEAFEAKFGKDSFATVKGIEMLGSIGPILSTDEIYFVFMKTGQRAELNESLEDAKPKITKRLLFEKRGQMYENVINTYKEKYKVKIHEDKIAKLSEGLNPPNGAQANAGAQPGQATPPVPGQPPAAIPVDAQIQKAAAEAAKNAAAGSPAK